MARTTRTNWLGSLHENEVLGHRRAGRSIDEIAQLAGMSADAVKTFLWRRRFVGSHGGARRGLSGTGVAVLVARQDVAVAVDVDLSK